MKPKARLNSQLPPGSGLSLVQRSARPAPEDNDLRGMRIVYLLSGIWGRESSALTLVVAPPRKTAHSATGRLGLDRLTTGVILHM